MPELSSGKFIDKDFIYAIVGATIKKQKYGYKVLVDLKDKGYKVVPINPKYGEVAGITCYPTLLSLEDRPDVVVLVVPPKVSQSMVKNCADLDLNKIWFQPGAEDDKVITLAKSLGLDIMTGKCIMQETS
jgi:uncharacterized protein